MSLTVTIDLARSNGSVRLNIDSTAAVTSVVRADANGTRPVRTRAGLLPRTGVFAVYDFEPSISGALNYRVTSSEGTVEVWTSLATGDGMNPIFTLPSVPEYFVSVELVTDYSAARESRSTIHEVIGRDDPMIALGNLRTRRGTLEIWSAEYQQARNLETLVERGQIAQYRQSEHPGMDMYLAVTSLDTAPDEDKWKTSLGYAEVNWPLGDVISDPAWTFTALAAGHPSFTAVAQEYDNFHQLTIGEES